MDKSSRDSLAQSPPLLPSASVPNVMMMLSTDLGILGYILDGLKDVRRYCGGGHEREVSASILPQRSSWLDLSYRCGSVAGGGGC